MWIPDSLYPFHHLSHQKHFLLIPKLKWTSLARQQLSTCLDPTRGKALDEIKKADRVKRFAIFFLARRGSDAKGNNRKHFGLNFEWIRKKKGKEISTCSNEELRSSTPQIKKLQTHCRYKPSVQTPGKLLAVSSTCWRRQAAWIFCSSCIHICFDNIVWHRWSGRLSFGELADSLLDVVGNGIRAT